MLITMKTYKYNSAIGANLRVEEVKGSGYPGESSYDKSKLKVHYLLQRAKTDSRYLLVIFSAFPKTGHPPVYNYVRTLSSITCNKLFILDEYGPSASYYLGENRVFDFEESVIALIGDVCEELGTESEQVISMGSSKGGFAALYFAVKYGFGHVIAAAPQTKLGNFVFSNHPDVAQYISGELSEDGRDFLNTLLPDALDKAATLPKIYLHVGRGDHHYGGHIMPLVEILRRKKSDYVLDVQEYELHSQVGMYFPGFLFSALDTILD